VVWIDHDHARAVKLEVPLNQRQRAATDGAKADHDDWACYTAVLWPVRVVHASLLQTSRCRKTQNSGARKRRNSKLLDKSGSEGETSLQHAFGIFCLCSSIQNNPAADIVDRLSAWKERDRPDCNAEAHAAAGCSPADRTAIDATWLRLQI